MSNPDKIADILRKASKAYYNTDQIIITDQEFDNLRSYLRSISPNHPFFNEVGAPVGHRDEIDLIGFMGSQLKVKTEKEAKEWFDTYNQPELIVSDKMDGSSVEVVFIDGKLTRVVTRGNGKKGLAITKNALLWTGLPHNIKAKGQLVVRGEAQLSVSNWKTYYSKTANPRNAGNGIVICDKESNRNRHISFNAFDITHSEVIFKKQSYKFKILKELGFNVVRWFRCKTWHDLIECRKQYIANRSKLDFEIDGMILAIEDLEVQKNAGFADGGTRPKGQRAFKFDTDRGVTTVTDIELTVGSTGKIVPTAVLNPIRLAGTTVTHCLLNNFDYIKNLGVNIGSKVLIEKAGDIIPHCIAVLNIQYKCSKCGFLSDYLGQENHDCDNKTLLAVDADYYQPPNVWRSKNGNDYELIKEGSDWKIVDNNCDELVFVRIKAWINKLGIKQLGDSALTALIDSGMVKEIPDLYSLDVNKISELSIGNGVIGSNANKIITEINKTRVLTIDNFIGSLSIKHLGRSRASLLIEKGFNSIDSYFKANTASFVGMPCSDTGTYGIDVANEIYNSLQNRKLIIEKLSNIIQISSQNNITKNGKLSGMILCFTGCRPSNSLQEMLEKEGATIKSSATKDLTHLVCKDKHTTSNKAKKAKNNGAEIIEMIDLEELLTE